MCVIALARAGTRSYRSVQAKELTHAHLPHVNLLHCHNKTLMIVVVSGVYGSSVESTSHMPSAPPTPPTAARWASADLPEQPKSSPAAEAERMTMYRCIISSIVESETIYLECLDVVLQVRATDYLCIWYMHMCFIEYGIYLL